MSVNDDRPQHGRTYRYASDRPPRHRENDVNDADIPQALCERMLGRAVIACGKFLVPILIGVITATSPGWVSAVWHYFKGKG